MSTLTILDIDSPKWMKPSEADYVIGGDVHLWRVHIPSNRNLLDGCKDVLSEAELGRAGEYQLKADKEKFIIARVVLRKLLGQYLGIAPNQLLIYNDINGKPYLANNDIPTMHFNLSHSGDWVLLGFSCQPIGVDIEYANPDFPYVEVMNNYFSPDEIEFVNKNGGCATFYKLWTRKESYLKAIGKGVSEDLLNTPCLNGIYNIGLTSINGISPLQTLSFYLNSNYLSGFSAYVHQNSVKFIDYIGYV